MLPILKAERQLEAIEAAIAPQMSKGDFRDTMRKHTDAVGGSVAAEPATEAALTAIGIPVEYVKAEVS